MKWKWLDTATLAVIITVSLLVLLAADHRRVVRPASSARHAGWGGSPARSVNAGWGGGPRPARAPAADPFTRRPLPVRFRAAVRDEGEPPGTPAPPPASPEPDRSDDQPDPPSAPAAPPVEPTRPPADPAAALPRFTDLIEPPAPVQPSPPIPAKTQPRAEPPPAWHATANPPGWLLWGWRDGGRVIPEPPERWRPAAAARFPAPAAAVSVPAYGIASGCASGNCAAPAPAGFRFWAR